MTRRADPDCWNCGGTGDDRPKGGGWHPDDSFPDCDCVTEVDEPDPDDDQPKDADDDWLWKDD